MISNPISDSAFRFVERAAVVNVTVLYDDVNSGLRARTFCECVFEELHQIAEFQLKFWRFDSLPEPEVRHEAVESSRHAAVVLLSIQQPGTLTVAVDDWIAEWLRKRPADESPCAFVFFLKENGAEFPISKQILARLRQAEAEERLVLLCDAPTPALARLPVRLESSDAAPARRAQIPVEIIRPCQSDKHWGING